MAQREEVRRAARLLLQQLDPAKLAEQLFVDLDAAAERRRAQDAQA
jgi:hypothetical protein